MNAATASQPEVSILKSGQKSNIHASTDGGRLLLAGMLADEGHSDALSKTLLAKKVDLRQLIDAAKYCEPTSDYLPSE